MLKKYKINSEILVLLRNTRGKCTLTRFIQHTFIPMCQLALFAEKMYACGSERVKEFFSQYEYVNTEVCIYLKRRHLHGLTAASWITRTGVMDSRAQKMKNAPEFWAAI